MLDEGTKDPVLNAYSPRTFFTFQSVAAPIGFYKHVNKEYLLFCLSLCVCVCVRLSLSLHWGWNLKL